MAIMTNLTELKGFLSKPRRIVITSHINPDGDAMGSSLALYNYLQPLGHKVSVVVPSNYPDFLKWMPGDQKVYIYPYQPAEAQRLIGEAELIFCLDYNALGRIGEVGTYVAANLCPKVLIDHHLFPDDFACYVLHKVEASSTAELVYEFLEQLGAAHKVDANIGACLYTGILTDTGGFQYPNTSARVHRIVANLLDAGVDHNKIYRDVFNSFTEDRLRLFGYCITEKLKIYPEYKATLVSLTKEELQRFHVRSGDTEGIVNYPLKIQGINFSALVVDRTEVVKLSFRSVGKFDVNQFSRSHFNGGGHVNAAGGQSKEPLDAVIAKFERVLPDFKEQLMY